MANYFLFSAGVMANEKYNKYFMAINIRPCMYFNTNVTVSMAAIQWRRENGPDNVSRQPGYSGWHGW